jgi:hypothetical protein
VRDAAHRAKWLLLVQQLPARPSNLRVHLWRRLQQVGSVSLRNSIYVLPNTPEAREDFDWIRAEIAGRGGQVSLLAADAVDGYTDDELEGAFRDARTADYVALIGVVSALTRGVNARTLRQRRAPLQRELAKARERFIALRAIDFFGSPRAGEAQNAIERLERELVHETGSESMASPLDVRAFKARVWVTRPRPGIDRMASAWLIRRYVAPDATFTFGSLPARQGHVPFDMPDVEFGHHGSECTFETLLRKFGIHDPAAVYVGQVVHDLDLKEARYGHPETATLGTLVDGLRESASDDKGLLADGMRLIEALYRSVSHATSEPAAKSGGRRPATRSSRRPAKGK